MNVEDINRVVLGGVLVRDSNFGYTAGKTAVATFTLAFHSSPDKGGLSKKRRSLIDIIFFGAKEAKWSQLLKKDKQVVVEGRLQQRSWVTREGIHKSKTEIVADLVKSIN